MAHLVLFPGGLPLVGGSYLTWRGLGSRAHPTFLGVVYDQ